MAEPADAPMIEPATILLTEAPLVVAPDGSDVRVLARLDGGSVAYFELAPGRVSRAVVHRTVSEIWYVVLGRGEMWRNVGQVETVVVLAPGVCVTIPVGTRFQFRSLGVEPLGAVAVTMPPWPGDDEAIRVDGCAAWREGDRPTV